MSNFIKTGTKVFSFNFKNILFSCVGIFAITIFLFSCGKRPLSENDLSKIIPNEILEYFLDGEKNKMLIKNFAIDRRQTNNKEDIVYTIIDMEDNYVHRTAYYILKINYYDKGGWIIDSWEKYKNTEAYPLQAPTSEDKIDILLNEKFSNFDFLSMNVDDLRNGYCSYFYNVNDIKPNFNRSGQVDIVYSFNGSDNCYWEAKLNITEVVTTWKIVGNWIDSSDVFSFNIEKITPSAIYASLRSDPFYDSSNVFSFASFKSTEFNYNESETELSFKGINKRTPFEIIFYGDNAKLEIIFGGTSNITNLIKK